MPGTSFLLRKIEKWVMLWGIPKATAPAVVRIDFQTQRSAIMSKGKDTKKETKKEPAKSMKEKKAAKKAKKEEKKRG